MKIKKNLTFQSLKFKLMFVSVFMTVMIAVAICALEYSALKRLNYNNTKIQFTEVVNQMSAKLNEKMRFTVEQFNYLENDDRFKELSRNLNSGNNVQEFIDASKRFEERRMQNIELIDNVFYYRYDGKLFFEVTNNIFAEDDITKQPWFEETRKSSGHVVWYPPYSQSLIKNRYGKVIGLTRELSDMLTNNYGILVFNLKQSYFENELRSSRPNQNYNFIIVDGKNRIIAVSDENKKFDEAINYTQAKKHSNKLINNSTDIIVSSRIPVCGWRIIGTVPKNAIGYNNQLFAILLPAFILLCVLMSCFYMIYILKYVVNPLNKMAGVMVKIQKNGLKGRFFDKSIYRYDEIGYLGRNFNSMLESIEKLKKQIADESRIKARAELGILQQQINSHFLYNVLDSIYWKIMNHDVTKSSEMVLRLAGYFRMALNHGNDMTTVNNEILHIKNYIEIENLRYANLIVCNIQIEQEIGELEIPKLILQPLVENTIVHGGFGADDKILIELHGYSDNDFAVLEVSDNGVGMDYEDIENRVKKTLNGKADGKEFALKNICTRLRLVYDDRADISFSKSQIGGAAVAIRIPYQRGEQL